MWPSCQVEFLKLHDRLTKYLMHSSMRLRNSKSANFVSAKNADFATQEVSNDITKWYVTQDVTGERFKD